MIEAIIPSTIAVITGIAVLTNRIYDRLVKLDRRIDAVELTMAQAYVSKGIHPKNTKQKQRSQAKAKTAQFGRLLC